MKTAVLVFLSIAVFLFLGSCSTPATNTPTPTITFTPEPTGTSTAIPFPTPVQGKGSVSVQIACVVAVGPQGQSLNSLMGSGHTISLIVVYPGLKYSFVAKAVTDKESRAFFNNIDPGVYSLAFGDASSVFSIPASSVLPSIGIVENETRDLGKMMVTIPTADCATLSH